MAIVYADADAESRSILDEVIKSHFPEIAVLSDPLVIDLRMAEEETDDDAGDGDGYAAPVVKRYGVGVPAKIAVVGPVERSRGGPDLRIIVDMARWREADEDACRGMLFSELNRVTMKRDKEGGLKRDPYGRPMIKLRPYDWVLAGFRETVRVFGDASPERRDLDRVEAMLSQKSLPFVADAADEDAA